MKPDSEDFKFEEKAERVAYLIAGYLQKSLTTEEHNQLDEWITESDENLKLFERLTDPNDITEGLDTIKGLDQESAYTRIKSKLVFEQPRRRSTTIIRTLMRVAAAVVVIAGLFFLFRQSGGDKEKLSGNMELIKPGRDYATLILPDGNVVELTSSKVQNDPVPGGIEIRDGKELVYSGKENAGMHKLTTPAGGQFRVTLADGTKVWLNASSSLEYPANFDSVSRLVVLNGEGYFEVESATVDKKPVPFIVMANGTQVEVTGTKFNVNAYKDEGRIITSLFEGGVIVKGGGRDARIRPGQKATSAENSLVVESDENLGDLIAWKSGVFRFRDAGIEQVMRQVARWYDVTVIYQGKPDFHFNATIDRAEPVNELLALLEQTGRVKFEISGKNIIVKP